MLQWASDRQYNEILHAARHFPTLHIITAKFKVVGEEAITPNSLATFIVKVKLTYGLNELSAPSWDEATTAESFGDKVKDTTSVVAAALKDDGNVHTNRKQKIESSQNVDEEDNSDDDLEIDDETGESIKKKHKRSILSRVFDEAENNNMPVYAPFFPEIKRPIYYIMLADSHSNRLICPPTKVINLTSEKRITLQFQAPPRIGKYELTCHIKGDGNVGVEEKEKVKV